MLLSETGLKKLDLKSTNEEPGKDAGTRCLSTSFSVSFFLARYCPHSIQHGMRARELRQRIASKCWKLTLSYHHMLKYLFTVQPGVTKQWNYRL